MQTLWNSLGEFCLNIKTYVFNDHFLYSYDLRALLCMDAAMFYKFFR